jgi:hypothetical protein
MKKAVIFVLASLVVLLAGCTAPGAGGSPGTDIPPTDPPSSENSPTSDLPEEIELVYDIEGTQETMILQKYTGQNFSVYIDEANFTTVESTREVNFILTDQSTYPEVSIAIGHEQSTSLQTWRDALSSGDSYSYEGERELGENVALWFHAKPEANTQRSGPTQDIYLIDGEDGFFAITVTCDLEASEGWGARMLAMINTFTPT